MKCTGPYTRVFFEKAEIPHCQALLDGLVGQGMAAVKTDIPKRGGTLDDLSCDMDLGHGDESWTLRLAKYLGPKKMLRQTHVFEATIVKNGPDGEAWRGHLFDTALDKLVRAAVEAMPVLRKGGEPQGLVPGDEAHEIRILMCAGEA